MDLALTARDTVRACNTSTCTTPLAVLGKAEGKGEQWHGHVTAVTIAPAYRRQRLAEKLMKLLEDVTEHMCEDDSTHNVLQQQHILLVCTGTTATL